MAAQEIFLLFRNFDVGVEFQVILCSKSAIGLESGVKRNHRSDCVELLTIFIFFALWAIFHNVTRGVPVRSGLRRNMQATYTSRAASVVPESSFLGVGTHYLVLKRALEP